MLEAQSLRTEAGVKSKKRSRNMFAGLKGFDSECTLLSNRKEKSTKMSAEIFTNGQRIRKITCSAL